MVIFMINTLFLMLNVFIIESMVTPKNDPGIIIWWLCCIRVGGKGKFSYEYDSKEKNKSKIIKTLE